jgi:hypothetical protein
MGLPHQNLAIAVGAAKEQAKALVLDVQRRGRVPTGRSSSAYLSLVVMHRQLLAVNPPPIAHFVPDLEQLARACSGALAPVKPLIEAALRVARDAPDAS